MPIIAISPAAETILPKNLLKSNPFRIAFPPIDAITVARCIRIVTGRSCKDYLDEDAAALLTASDLTVAIRFDRTPTQCMAELRRLVALKQNTKPVAASLWRICMAWTRRSGGHES